MATVRLNPGALSVTTGTPTIAGPPPEWADDTDATYAAMTTVTASTGGATRRDGAEATLDLLTTDPASVTAITAHLRASATSDTSDGPRLAILLYRPNVKNILTIAPDDSLGWVLPNDGTAADHEFLIDNYAEFGTTLAQVAIDLTTTTAATVYPHTALTEGGTTTITVYEFWLSVTAGGGPAPALRLYPRADGLGTSSARRHYPRPQSRQRGGRTWGATYI